MAYVVWRVVMKKYAKVRLGLTHRGTEPVSVVLLQIHKTKVSLLVNIDISCSITNLFVSKSIDFIMKGDLRFPVCFQFVTF